MTQTEMQFRYERRSGRVQKLHRLRFASHSPMVEFVIIDGIQSLRDTGDRNSYVEFPVAANGPFARSSSRQPFGRTR